jgi:S1-C subfamily serine protease
MTQKIFGIGLICVLLVYLGLDLFPNRFIEKPAVTIRGLQGERGIQGIVGEKGDTWYNDLPKLYNQTFPAVVWIGAEYSDDEFLSVPWKEISRKRDKKIPITVKWQGTGFFVSPNLIATAGHVVKDTKSFIVQFQDGSQAYADFVHMESLNRCDVGFIQLRKEYRSIALSPLEHPFLSLNTKVEVGESLVILGYPWGLNNGIALTQGVVSLSNREELFFGVKLVMHIDAASYPGNSGSPVINMEGEVVGILIGGRYGCDNWSIVTHARLVELAMQKALAEIGLREVK